jgi:uncharacterized RDD family membrane protein YckC
VNRRAKESGGVGGVVGAVGRAALRPGRALVGSKGLDVPRRLETLAVDAAATPAAARTVDGLLAGPLPEVIGRALSDHRVIERIVDEMMARTDFEQALVEAFESERMEQLRIDLTDRVLASPEFEQIVARVLASPQVRAALTQQSTTFASEMIEGVRHRTERADAAVERAPRRWLRRRARPNDAASGSVRVSYAGLATRTAAFTLDLVLVALTFVTGAAFAALITSLVGHLRPVWLVDLLAGIAWVVLSGTYFVAFWSAVGQTPGMRLLGVRVLDPAGRPPGLGRSLARLVGLVVAAVPCFLGFLPILFDNRRRGLQDFIAGTVVVYTDPAVVGLDATHRRRAERRGPPTVASAERQASQTHPS